MIGFYLWILFFMLYGFFVLLPWWLSVTIIVLSILAVRWDKNHKRSDDY